MRGLPMLELAEIKRQISPKPRQQMTPRAAIRAKRFPGRSAAGLQKSARNVSMST
jgi:hypothetical protein